MKPSNFFKSIFSTATAVFCAFLFAFVYSACNSAPKEIPEDLEASQLIQQGQDNYYTKHYKVAEAYFEAVLERFGDNPKNYVEAKYELGHMYLKTKRYEEAYNNFNEILSIYEAIPVGLPGAYKKLCQIELQKIPQKAMDQIAEKKAAQEADLAAEAEKVKAEEEERKAKEAEKEAKRNQNVQGAKPLPVEVETEEEVEDEEANSF